MALHWKRRLSEWVVVARKHHGLASGLTMLRALMSGPVPADVWRSRIRVCLRCPVLSRSDWACHAVLADGRVCGCKCYVPYLALTAVPYEGGCWAHQYAPPAGWPAYKFPSFRAKVAAVFRFLFP